MMNWIGKQEKANPTLVAKCLQGKNAQSTFAVRVGNYDEFCLFVLPQWYNFSLR
jgi:hypothetical protein